MAKELRPNEVMLKDVRLSFPHLFKPSASVEGGQLKFRATALIDPTTPQGKANIKAVEAAIEFTKKDVWGDKADKVRFKEGRLCFTSGEENLNADGDVYQGYEGMMAVSAANSKRPPIVDRDKSTLVEEDGKPYAGCYVNMLVRFYGIKDQDKGGNGLFATLEAVQFKRDGEAFGSAPVDPDDVFDMEDDEDVI